MVVILLGAPGVGKGTQAVRLADDTGAVHVSTGDLLRAACRDGTPLGKKARGYMDAGELVPDDLILGLVKEHVATLPAGTDILFDGFPRTIAQAEGLDVTLREEGLDVGVVVHFEADDDVLMKRLSGRRSCPECGAVYNIHFDPPAEQGVCDRCGAELVHREDDAPETVQRRLEVYREQTAPLIEHYGKHRAEMIRIDGDRSFDAVYEDFKAAVVGARA